jgi:hypothetical protein
MGAQRCKLPAFCGEIGLWGLTHMIIAADCIEQLHVDVSTQCGSQVD